MHMSDVIVRTSRGTPILPLLNPLFLLRNLFRHRQLTIQLAKRDILGRYRTAQLGLVWSIITPLVLLAIYTFVFTIVFPGNHWTEDPNESKGIFALAMFCGMLVFNLFAELVNRAPGLIVSNPNYVRKVVFPLEVFVPASLISALFNLLVGLVVWLVGRIALVGLPPITILWLPIVLLPVCLVTLGIGWVLASVGVFIRDVNLGVGLVVQVLFFGTPIFYSLKRVPHPYREILEINPLTHAVEDARNVLMWGHGPDWSRWCVSLAIASVVAVLGCAFFLKSKRAFGDVL